MKIFFIITFTILVMLMVTRSETKAMEDNSLINAVMKRDIQLVDRLIEQGAFLEARNHRGSTALRIASGSEQFLIAEKLFNAGADPFTMDSLYITAVGGILHSNLIDDTDEGAARIRLLKAFRDRGVPMPPPAPAEMKDALKNGQWPDHAKPPPLKH